MARDARDKQQLTVRQDAPERQRPRTSLALRIRAVFDCGVSPVTSEARCFPYAPYLPALAFSILAHVSRSVTVRLSTSRSSVVSGSTQT